MCNVMFSDSGFYTVSVSNHLGESLKKLRVIFQCKPWYIVLYLLNYISYLVWLKKTTID